MATQVLFDVTINSRDRVSLVNFLEPGTYWLRYPGQAREQVQLNGVVEDVFTNEPFAGDWGVIAVFECWTRTTRVLVASGSTVNRSVIYTPVRTGIRTQLIRVF